MLCSTYKYHIRALYFKWVYENQVGPTASFNTSRTLIKILDIMLQLIILCLSIQYI